MLFYPNSYVIKKKKKGKLSFLVSAPFTTQQCQLDVQKIVGE